MDNNFYYYSGHPWDRNYWLEVAIFQGLIYTHMYVIEKKRHMAIIERWPQFRGLGSTVQT